MERCKELEEKVVEVPTLSTTPESSDLSDRFSNKIRGYDFDNRKVKRRENKSWCKEDMLWIYIEISGWLQFVDEVQAAVGWRNPFQPHRLCSLHTANFWVCHMLRHLGSGQPLCHCPSRRHRQIHLALHWIHQLLVRLCPLSLLQVRTASRYRL